MKLKEIKVIPSNILDKKYGNVFENRFKNRYGECTDEPLMVFPPPGENWVEILGHRFEGVNGFEGMIEYLNNYRNLEKELNDLLNKRAYLIDYLIEKLETAKLMATYENGVRYPSLQEMIYEDILNKVDSQK